MKKIFIILLILALILAAGGFLLYKNFDEVVKIAIEHIGSETLQTEVKVSQVVAKPEKGAIAIYGMTVANPDGFSTPHAFSLNEISTKVNIAASSETKIVIDEFIIHSPIVMYEMNNARKANLSLIADNLDSSTAGSTSSSNESGPGINLVIHKLSFTEGKVQAKIAPLKNKQYNMTLPPIVMSNLGGNRGAPPDVIAKQIFKRLIKQASHELRKRGIDAKLDSAKQRLKSKKQALKDDADKKLGTEKQGLKDRLKNKLN